MRYFLNKKYANKEKIIGPAKQIIYIRFPYISKYMNEILNREIRKIMLNHLPQIDLRLAIYNNYKIRSFFKIKDKLPNDLCSSIVYLFSCSKCSLEYIGSTTRNLTVRVDEHRGISSRTSCPLVRPLNSSIREHCNSCSSNFNINNFKIINKATYNEELRIMESILIKLRKPTLNVDDTAHPLYIF